MPSITSNDLENEINNATSRLLEIAREITWNKISDNCKFILSEIKNTEQNVFEQRRLRKKENDAKNPVGLKDIIPSLQMIYDNLYDINLYIYKSTERLTVIDIRYYPKSSLDEIYRQIVSTSPPMLHCKVDLPFWETTKKKKFDVNWEHNTASNNWKMFWLRLKLKNK